jgi:MFS family permease
VHSIRRPHAATAALFFATGAVFASWAARIPAIQERLQLSPGALSIALVGMEAGAIAGLPGGGRLVPRIGSATALRIGFALFPPALVAAALAPTLAWLVAALVVMGASNSLIDVALNAQGIELERRARRPVLSGLHSGHSFGVLAGGLVGTILAAQAVPVGLHFAAAAALCIVAAQRAAAALVDDRRSSQAATAEAVADPSTDAVDGSGAATAPPPTDALASPPAAPDAPTAAANPPRRALATLGVLAFCAFFVEGAANDWSAVHTREVHDASPTLAAAAFTAFSLTLALGRLAGDRLVGRAGRGRAIRAGGLLAAAGAAAVVAAPSAATALVAWALLGAGVAAIAPTLLGAAPSKTTAPPASAVATVSMIGYAGSFAGPPAIGAIAELTSLQTALASLTLGALAIAALAPRALAPNRRPGSAIAPAIRQYYDPTSERPAREGAETPANQPFPFPAASDSTRTP